MNLVELLLFAAARHLCWRHVYVSHWDHSQETYAAARDVTADGWRMFVGKPPIRQAARLVPVIVLQPHQSYDPIFGVN